MTDRDSFFALPDRLAAKRSAALIADDDEWFRRIDLSIAHARSDVAGRLVAERRKPGGSGQAALDRDLEVRRLATRERTLERYGVQLCLGRMVAADGSVVYLGRVGLADADGSRLLLDWRAPAARPFFAATLGDPMGLVSRRRYRWAGARVSDYWDEALTLDAVDGAVALDDQSAFITSLGDARTPRMRDVLGTLQADQDAIIRAGSEGALVVDGGPGTGKTVVALHRAAYLLAADARVSRSRGGVLIVGPSHPYLAYVADVLPGLGEEGVQMCTVRDLVHEGAAAPREDDAEVARLKGSRMLTGAVAAAVAVHEQPPRESVIVETEWADVVLDAADWADAFAAAAPGTPHNEAREEVWEELLTIVIDRLGEDVPPRVVRRALAEDEALRARFAAAWPLLDPLGVIADLWSVPDYLRQCAPRLDGAEVLALQREDPRRWTASDLPFLDEARSRIGDPGAGRDRRRRAVALEAQREQMERVVDELIAADDDGLGLVTMLRSEDARESLIDDSAVSTPDPDVLAGPFAHIVVDEAQELSDAEWRMLLRRCPSRSFTIVGDRAQARAGFRESWEERLGRVGVDRSTVLPLTVNYRTPEEVMAVAAPVIRAALPDANVPTSVRSSGVPVERADVAGAERLLAEWTASGAEGVACVISAEGSGLHLAADGPRVRRLTPAEAKGLEFDLVVLLDPEGFGDGVTGAVDRYVAMTRATRRLVLVDPPTPGTS